MINVKSLFASKTLWTAFIGFVFAVLAAAGVLPSGFDSTQATGVVLAVLTALTGLFRYQATAQLAPSKEAARRMAARQIR